MRAPVKWPGGFAQSSRMPPSTLTASFEICAFDLKPANDPRTPIECSRRRMPRASQEARSRQSRDRDAGSGRGVGLPLNHVNQ
jgi:hypothetical protein